MMHSKAKPSAGLILGRLVGGFFAMLGRLFLTMIMVGIITGCIVASVLTVYVLNMVGADEQINLDVERLGYSSTMVAIDKDGNEVELQKLYLPDNNRVWVNFEDISPWVIQAVIATEDKRFADVTVDGDGNVILTGGHQGVDWRRSFGAMVDMFLPGASEGGGSTLTQQLIKNLTNEREVRVDRKVREIFRALDVETRYTKKQIIEAYLNTVPFGAGTDGIESAALTYFGKHAKDLTLAEASSIAGITKAPGDYNPRIYPENNKARQGDVLFFMREQGKITSEEEDAAFATRLVFRKDDVQQTTQQTPTYFEDHVVATVLKDLQEQMNWTEGYAFEQLYKGGYKIITTVDVEMQKYLEEFYLDVANFPPVRNAEYPQSAAVILDHHGKILAIVGAIGDKVGARTFNRATQATRQPGSALKMLGPYSQAFEYDIVNWSTLIDDHALPESQSGSVAPWPRNHYGAYRGLVTVAYAVQQSTNTVAAKLTHAIGPEPIFNFLQNSLNFYNLVDNRVDEGRIVTDVSLAPMSIGALTYGVTPLEMVGGYQIYANGGTFTSPYCYTEVRDANGRVILKADTTPIRVISEDTSIVVNKLLQTVNTVGTGATARLDNMPTAGKTGTSDDDVNQWYMGMTPYYVCGVWLGFDRETYVDEYGRTQPNGIGYNSYGPPILWKSIMAPLHEGLETKEFLTSDAVVSKTFCTQSGLLAGPNCGSVGSGWYKAAKLPATCSGRHATGGEGEESRGQDEDGRDSDSDGDRDEPLRVPWYPEDD